MLDPDSGHTCCQPMMCRCQILPGTFPFMFSVIFPITQGDQCSRSISKGNSIRKYLWHVSGSQLPEWWSKFSAGPSFLAWEWKESHSPADASSLSLSYPSVTWGMRGFCLWLWWLRILRKWPPCFCSARVANPMNGLWPKPFLLSVPLWTYF